MTGRKRSRPRGSGAVAARAAAAPAITVSLRRTWKEKAAYHTLVGDAFEMQAV